MLASSMAKKRVVKYVRGTPQRSGTVRMLYSEKHLPESLGTNVRIHRAANVEPTEELSPKAVFVLLEGAHGLPKFMTFEPELANRLRESNLPPGKWWADCTPLDGPVLGPFDTRSQALQAENDWLVENF